MNDKIRGAIHGKKVPHVQVIVEPPGADNLTPLAYLRWHAFRAASYLELEAMVHEKQAYQIGGKKGKQLLAIAEDQRDIAGDVYEYLEKTKEAQS